MVAFDGHGPTPEAVLASRQWGADISKHRSTRLTPELINDADLIFCMMDFHVDAVRRMVPSGAGKVFRLDPEGAVPDPIGGGVEVYVRAAEQIQHALEAHLEKDF